MTLEASVTYISDLDPLSPTGAEAKAQGDDHVRYIKTALKNAFPGFSGAVLVTGTDGGAVNAYTLTPTTPLVSYTVRTAVIFTPTIANTGAATLNVSGLGVKAIVATDGTALVSGDLPLGYPVLAIYDGTSFRIPYVTKRYMDALVVSNTLPGVADPANAGKYYKTDGTTGSWASIDGRGAPVLPNVNSAASALVIDYAAGEGQTITATGNFSLSATGFPVSKIAGVLVRAVNWGAYAPTSTGITWIKSDNTQTTTFASSGIVLPSSGTGLIAIFSYGDGIIYGKAA